MSPGALAETRMALVIGNSSYRSVTALRNPTNDASAIAGVLTNAGFEVMSVTDVTQGDMRRAIRDFASKVAEKGANTVALVFYAGHGLQVDGENFLVPIDARIERESDVAIETMRLADVMNALATVPSKIRIVMLDACRNNPFEAVSKGGGKGLAIVDAPSGSIVAYATAPGAEALDGAGRNSPYTAAFLKAVKQPELQIEQLFKRVRLLVNDATDGKQVPWESSSLTSDFWFFPVAAAPPKKLDLPPAAGDQATPASQLPIKPPPPSRLPIKPPLPGRLAINRPPPSQLRSAEPRQACRDRTRRRRPKSFAKVKELRLEARRAEIHSRPVNAAYEIVIEEDDVLLYEEFIAAYADDPLAERIRRLLFRRQDAIAWRAATVTNTPEAYGEYRRGLLRWRLCRGGRPPAERPRLRPIDPILVPRIAPRVVIRPPTVRPPTVRPPIQPVARPPVAPFQPKGLPATTTLPKALPKATSVPPVLPKATTVPQGLPKATSVPPVLPKATSVPQGLPKATSVPPVLPKATSVPQGLPKATRRAPGPAEGNERAPGLAEGNERAPGCRRQQACPGPRQRQRPCPNSRLAPAPRHPFRARRAAAVALPASVAAVVVPAPVAAVEVAADAGAKPGASWAAAYCWRLS